MSIERVYANELRYHIEHTDVFAGCRRLKPKSIHAVVSSPPYFGLRDYGIPPRTWKDGQVCCYGLEADVDSYVRHTVELFEEFGRVLRDDGVIWWNVGDTFSSEGGERTGGSSDGGVGRADAPGPRIKLSRSGSKLLVPHRVAIALSEAGWIVRQDNVWAKKNPMAESVTGWRHVKHRLKLTHEDLYEVFKTVASLRVLHECDGSPGRGIGLQGMHEEETAVLQPKRGRKTKAKGVRSKRTGGGEQPQTTELREGEGNPSAHPLHAQLEALAKEILGIGEGEGRREEVPGNRPGKPETTSSGKASASEGHRPVPHPGNEVQQVAKGEGPLQAVEAVPSGEGVQKARGQEVQGVSQGPVRSSEVEQQAPSSVSGSSLHSDAGRMGGNQGGSERSVPLLQEEAKTDSGSCEAGGEGGGPYEGEYRRSVFLLQLQERLSHRNPVLKKGYILLDCPGCEKCRESGGYVLRKGAHRTTSAHEFVFQIAKSQEYFTDGDAAKEQVSGNAHSRGHGMNPKAAGIEKSSGVRSNSSYAAHHAGSTLDRNPRSVWSMSSESYRGGHFATFPSELVRRCIVGSLSPGGCCPECGSQYAPRVNKASVATRPGTATKIKTIGPNSRMRKNFDPSHEEDGRIERGDQWNSSVVGNRDPGRHVSISQVDGYYPTCDCHAGPPVPPLLLEPFTGSGTTLQVANHYGHRSIGFEINPDYIELAKDRVPKTPRCAKKKGVKSQPDPSPNQPLLF